MDDTAGDETRDASNPSVNDESNSFAVGSYQRHADHYDDYGPGGRLADRVEAWKRTDTVDAWRHRRMYRLLDPLIVTQPAATWVTIGDGRLASDARYLQSRSLDVVATDISETLLRVASDAKLIQRYQVENAESLSFVDGQFDFVLCKESYHHFPRPAIAIYEMLRVARIGIVLIEPVDDAQARTPWEAAFSGVRHAVRSLRHRTKGHAWEDTGNYVYSLSRHELEKMALGLNLRHIAFGGLNDLFLEGVHEEATKPPGPLYRKIRRWITVRDVLCRLGLMQPGLLVAVLFKGIPPAGMQSALEGAGYDVAILPKNPYV
jgi:SAM-dependent methyltransferase